MTGALVCSYADGWLGGSERFDEIGALDLQRRLGNAVPTDGYPDCPPKPDPRSLVGRGWTVHWQTTQGPVRSLAVQACLGEPGGYAVSADGEVLGMVTATWDRMLQVGPDNGVTPPYGWPR